MAEYGDDHSDIPPVIARAVAPMDVSAPTLFAPTEPPLPSTPRPWGFWATLGFTIAIMFAVIVAQSVTAVPFFLDEMRGSPGTPLMKIIKRMETNGAVLSVATLVSMVVSVGLSIAAAALRRRISVRQYLGLCWPARRIAIRALVATAVFVIVTDALTSLTGRPVVSPFMREIYNSAGSITLLLLAINVAAPISEEVLFRGFAFTGFRWSPAGPVVAAVLTSLCWTALHVQYDMVEMTPIFVGGLLLAYVRWKSDSTLLPIAMHVLWNLIATLETVAVMHGWV